MHRSSQRVLLVVAAMAVGLGIVATGAVAKKTKLTIWTNGWPMEYTRTAYKMFEKDHPDVTVNVVAENDRGRFLLAVATGTAPDLMTFVTPISELSDRGLLLPLNSYLNTSKIIKTTDYNPGVLDIFTTAGKVYAIPSIEVGPWLGLIYNKAAFEEAGLNPDEPAKTLEELQVANRKLTKMNGTSMTRMGMNPIGSMGSVYFPETWGQVFGASTIDPKTRRIRLDTPEMVKAVEYVNSFFDLTSPSGFSNWWAKSGYDWGGSIARGTQAMEINGYWTPGQVALTNPKARIGTYWVPNVKGDKMMAYGGWGLAIPKGSKNANVAWQFIEYMTTKAPAQYIFDKHGFLNGNRRSIRELDFSAHPGAKWFLQALDTADRVTTTSDVPTWDKCVRSYLWAGLQEVCWSRKTSPQDMLRQVQKLTDIEQDKYFKRITK